MRPTWLQEDETAVLASRFGFQSSTHSGALCPFIALREKTNNHFDNRASFAVNKGPKGGQYDLVIMAGQQVGVDRGVDRDSPDVRRQRGFRNSRAW